MIIWLATDLKLSMATVLSRGKDIFYSRKASTIDFV